MKVKLLPWRNGAAVSHGQRVVAGSRQRRSGSVTVQFAFVAPVMFMTIFGIFEIGRGLMVIHLLNNAAQIGCRTGVTPGMANSNVTSAVDTALTAVSISSPTVKITVNGNSVDVSTANQGDAISVTVSVTASSVSWLPFMKYITGNLSGQYWLRHM
jgi:Flp pilus assembly protein TadG